MQTLQNSIWGEADLKLVKSIITNKVKDKNKVLAVMRGNRKTTLDDLNSIWTTMLENAKNISWAYYQSNRNYNSLYLLTN